MICYLTIQCLSWTDILYKPIYDTYDGMIYREY